MVKSKSIAYPYGVCNKAKQAMPLCGEVVAKDACLFCSPTRLGQWLIGHDVYWEGMLALCKDCLSTANMYLTTSRPTPCMSCSKYRGACNALIAGYSPTDAKPKDICSMYRPQKGRVLLEHLHVLADRDPLLENHSSTRVDVDGDRSRMTVGFAGTGVVGNFSRICGHPHARVMAKFRSIAIAGSYGFAVVGHGGVAAARHKGCFIIEDHGRDSATRIMSGTAGDGVVEPDVLYRLDGDALTDGLKLVHVTNADLLELARIIQAHMTAADQERALVWKLLHGDT